MDPLPNLAVLFNMGPLQRGKVLAGVSFHFSPHLLLLEMHVGEIPALPMRTFSNFYGWRNYLHLKLVHSEV